MHLSIHFMWSLNVTAITVRIIETLAALSSADLDSQSTSVPTPENILTETVLTDKKKCTSRKKIRRIFFHHEKKISLLNNILLAGFGFFLPRKKFFEQCIRMNIFMCALFSFEKCRISTPLYVYLHSSTCGGELFFYFTMCIEGRKKASQKKFVCLLSLPAAEWKSLPVFEITNITLVVGFPLGSGTFFCLLARSLIERLARCSPRRPENFRRGKKALRVLCVVLCIFSCFNFFMKKLSPFHSLHRCFASARMCHIAG